jgi:actin-related protein
MGTRERTVVCDNGTGFVKAGFAGDTFPRATFPCMVGRPLLRYEEDISTEQLRDIMVGDDCAAQRHNLEVSYPVTNGARCHASVSAALSPVRRHCEQLGRHAARVGLHVT